MPDLQLLKKIRNELWFKLNPNHPPSKENDFVAILLASAKYNNAYKELNGKYPEADEVETQIVIYQQKCKEYVKSGTFSQIKSVGGWLGFSLNHSSFLIFLSSCKSGI